MGGGDYSAMLEAAKAYKPDLFIWAGYDADALPMLEAAKAMKFSPPLFVGAPPGWPADFGKSPLANNVMLYGMWAPAINDVNPVSLKFYNGYMAKYKAEPATYFAPLSYSAVYILADALKRAGNSAFNADGSVNNAVVIKALEGTKYLSALGETITFAPSNVIKHQAFATRRSCSGRMAARKSFGRLMSRPRRQCIRSRRGSKSRYGFSCLLARFDIV